MYQQITLIGNVGTDIETRSMPNGNTVANFRMATSETWKDKEGERQKATEWHNIVVFGKTADIAAEYVAKGNLVTIIGRVRTRKWEDKEGNDRYTYEVIADKLVLMPQPAKRGERSEDPDDAPPRQSRGTQTRKPAAQREEQADGFDDDIPF
jgi:single-strand DNA-binding protein